MRNLILTAFTVFCLTSILPAGAQEMKSTSWSAYGVSFKVPADITIEDESEEGYVLSNEAYYINVQILEGESINKDALSREIKMVATDDQLEQQTPVTQFELPQFHGAQLKGVSEGEQYLYSFLMAKDESCGFFVTVIYQDQQDETPADIVKSFLLED